MGETMLYCRTILTLIIALSSGLGTTIVFAKPDAPVAIGRMLHPSPASPAANRGWSQAATAELRDLGIEVPAVRRPSEGG